MQTHITLVSKIHDTTATVVVETSPAEMVTLAVLAAEAAKAAMDVLNPEYKFVRKHVINVAPQEEEE